MEIKMIYATKGEYVLLRTDNTVEPYVVAWWPDFKEKYEKDFEIPKPDWAQGHYFDNILPASIYFGETAKGEADFWSSDLYEI
ncbi:hypothetical protein SELR_pSRC400170 (plasmid) [Selenomonas ruminantium subsp. lactilytica TAM6421]|uniref:Uncharacterized protein n=1 Tax=Selenomonas ruminantium subsp. lactilytica (strain NBRC 103574 / TAM6421) TaxID=927704 RepID=I0GV81_SELRL|nr:hypothetical protein [Selenomonas ruminantium]BAL84668.1 hypothetical protein SELR_pSRC400170 [Selenomonas ruminantium subsp. lactilytica TAM6421]